MVAGRPVPEPSGTGVGSLMLRAALSWEATLEGRDRGRAVRLAREAVRDDRLWHSRASPRQAGCTPTTTSVTSVCAPAPRPNARGSLYAALSVNAWEGVWRWRKGELAEAGTCCLFTASRGLAR